MRAATSLSVFLLSLVLVVGAPGLAAAQQQEKRIALVIGNGAYAKSPLATAANDAGLIAQTLQAAGFEVVGARDLDGDTLRKSFREFIQKAETSGPDTVAMVYLAGYGLQLAGENYFIPVDSSIGRETDIPVEGLRISDYLRLLASLPLKAGIVVLDAARQQPFIEGGQPIASGLALVEPDAHMLVAYNAAPGTVAPAEEGSYGAYAQALAEMIRSGGLPLPELFDRVRLRVNETTKGAQVPWHAQKVDANFVFFDRAPDAPAQPQPDQVAAVRNKPIRDLGVQDAYAAVLERDTLGGYEEFIAAYPGDPMAKRVRALAAARREAIVWQRTYRADTPEAYWSYLRRYPNGPHAADARRRLAILTAPPEPPPTFTMYDYDVPPPPPEEIVYVDRPVLAFDDPYFEFAPPPPPPVFFLPPPPPEFVVLEPPPPPIGLFILPQPLFVPIPIYVRPPVYVRPPPNNIIYANIHNRRMIDTVINRPPPPMAPGGQIGGVGRRGGPPGMAPRDMATPGLPPSVAQRASLIQQGKLPVPPSASINPREGRRGPPGAPGALGGPGGPLGPRGGAAPNAPLPASVAPNAPPAGQPLPRANTLPVPGTKGAPPPPPPSAAVNPGEGRRGPPGSPAGLGGARPGQLPPAAAAVPGTPGAPAAGSAVPGAPAPGAPSLGAPGAPRGPAANVPPPAAGAPNTSGPGPVGARPGIGESPRRPGAGAPPGPPPSAANLPARPIAPTPPPGVRAPAGPPPSAARPAPRLERPAPPPRISAPPPRVAAPPPPPPRPVAPPPMARPVAPPPQMARPVAPPPPQMARPAAPPPMARPAAPPPMARPMAPPPVARAAPPPPAAAAKRCPPGVPRC